VIDAAGAIYVIGGYGGGTTVYNDVWASTDGGARAGLHRGRGRGVLEGVLQGGVLEWGSQGTKGYKGVQRGSIGILRSTRGKYLMGTKGY
jgi:hypothetical protein